MIRLAAGLALAASAFAPPARAVETASSPGPSAIPSPAPSTAPSAKPSPRPRAELVREFQAAMTNALRSTDLAGLESLVHPRMYFPEQADFGCAGADRKREYLAAAEFAKCARTSEARRKDCGEFEMTLREALIDCFLNAAAKFDAGGLSATSPAGSLCNLDEVEGKLVVSAVACGC